MIRIFDFSDKAQEDIQYWKKIGDKKIKRKYKNYYFLFKTLRLVELVNQKL